MIPTNPYDPVVDPGEEVEGVYGMTKREYFAAVVLGGLAIKL